MNSFFNNENQMNFMILLASIIGIYLGGSWTYNEIVVVKTLWENNLDISWVISISLILFFLAIFLISLLLFIGSILEFKLNDFLQNNEFRHLVKLTVFFNVVIVIVTLINEYILQIQNNNLIAGFIFTFLIILYILGAKKKGINPFYFLVVLATLSIGFWYLMFLLF